VSSSEEEEEKEKVATTNSTTQNPVTGTAKNVIYRRKIISNTKKMIKK
jgi:hypothetical protein